MDPNTLKQLICAAFPAGRLHDLTVALHACPECDRVNDDFRGKRWTEVDAPTIEYHFDSLPLLSPDAFRHYVPAYMVYAIDHPDSTIAEFLMYSMENSGGRHMPGFTAQQEQAIAAVCSLLSERADSAG